MSDIKQTLQLRKEHQYAGDLDVNLDGLEYDMSGLGVEQRASPSSNTENARTAPEQQPERTSQQQLIDTNASTNSPRASPRGGSRDQPGDSIGSSDRQTAAMAAVAGATTGAQPAAPSER